MVLAAFALCTAFVVPGPAVVTPVMRAPAARMVDIPRIDLPSQVTSALTDLDLKNPNDLSATDYNTYSAAAIGGTLALFVPGALVFDVSGVIGDFLLSAIIGGGLGAFLALRSDAAGEFANKAGAAIVDAVGADIPRISLPSSVTGALKDLDLKNPNDLSTTDYNTYSAAAIGGTLLLFLPGILVFDISGAVIDFILSAVVGGGLGAYLALRKDGAGEAANKAGAALLSALDKIG